MGWSSGSRLLSDILEGLTVELPQEDIDHICECFRNFDCDTLGELWEDFPQVLDWSRHANEEYFEDLKEEDPEYYYLLFPDED